MTRTNLTSFSAATCVALSVLGFSSATPAHAAALEICDAGACGSLDPNITISANDFERGFSVNGSQIQIGLHNPGSVSVPEAGSFVDGAAQTTFSGSWIDRSAVTPVSATIFFTEHGNSVSDVLNYNYSTAGGLGHLTGYVISDVNGVLPRGQLAKLGIIATATVSEATPFAFNNAFISATFQSDVDAIPEPATWAMMVIGFVGLGFAGYRASRKSVALAA
jgi:hypothetical protein